MTELCEPGDAVAGEKLVAWGRKVSPVHIISDTSVHRAQSVYVWGKPASCRIDIAVRLRGNRA